MNVSFSTLARPLLASLLLSTTASAQTGAPRIGCIDPDARLLADEVKQHYRTQGFAPLRDAMIGMTPGLPLPVVISLRADAAYQVIFVGNKKAKSLEAEIRDGSEQQVFSKTERFRSDVSRVIEFPFRPRSNDAYLFILKQFGRGEEVCGSFTILRDTIKSRKVAVQPYTRP